MTTSRPDFPLIWDSTMVAAAKACERKCALAYFYHHKPKATSIHLHAGGAYAKALERARGAYYTDGLSAGEAMAEGARTLIRAYGDYVPADGEAKTLDRMLGALAYYFDVWPLDRDYLVPAVDATGKRMVEFSFAETLDELHHPITGDPLIYAGRTDTIMEHTRSRVLVVHDDKTTGSLGDSWARQWALRGQFTGYCWAARRAGIPVAGVTVRGLGILKTKFSSAEAGPLARPEWMVEEWYASVISTIRRMMAAWESGAFDADFSESCNAYGGCGFRDACLTSPQFRDEYLDAVYRREVWNPLEKHDT